MRRRFAVPVTLAVPLAFFAVMSIGAFAQAQRPGEHAVGDRHDNVHAKDGHIPEPPAHRFCNRFVGLGSRLRLALGLPR